MKRLVINKKIVFLIVFAVFLLGNSSATVVVDSADWQEAFSMSMHAAKQGHTPYMVTTTSGTAVESVLPYTDDIGIMLGSETFASNIETQLETSNFDIGEVNQYENPNIELMPDQIDQVFVIDGGHPAAAVMTAPLAQLLDSWVLVANERNMEEILDILEEGDMEVVLVGNFDRDRKESLEEHADRLLTGENNFEVSIDVAEMFLEHEPVTRATVTDGQFLERDMFDGSFPILISGVNLLPEETEEYLRRSNIQDVVMLGNHMTDVGEQIQDNVDIAVFVKYGQARGGETRTEALTFYPLPGAESEIEIGSVEYDPGSEQLVVEYVNPSGVNLYILSSIEIGDDTTIDSVADDETLFVGSESSIIETYDLQLDPNEVEYMEAAFTSRFGMNPNQLDTYITGEDSHTPPFFKDIELSELEDGSEIIFKDAYYRTDVSRFVVEVENTGESTAYVSASVLDFIEGGSENSGSSNVEQVEPEEEETLYVPADLDEIDLEENEVIKVDLRFGENEDVLINTNSHEVEFTTGGIVSAITGGVTANAGSIGLSLLFILLGIFAYLFITRESGEQESQGYSYGGYSG